MDLVSLKAELRQELKLTPQLLQSMEILQMNSQELAEYLNRAAEENPLLEQEEAPELRQAYEELCRKAAWLDAGAHSPTFAHDPQAAPERLPKPLLALCTYMAQLVDEDGYLLQEDLDGLTELKIPQSLIQQALDTLQSLEPAGVAARDLSECLSLQLVRQGTATSAALDIAARFLPELGRKHYAPICRELGLTLEEVHQAERLITALSPRPGQAFQPAEAPVYVRPDVFIVELDGEPQVVLNEYCLPRITLNSYYTRLLQESDERETQVYLRQKMQQAKWLLTSLERRGGTLRRCAQALLETQRPFFTGQTRELTPMKLTSLAQALAVHPSTVSRALHGKYLQCRQGTYPLRYFFNRAVGGGLSRQAVKQKLLLLVRDEDPRHPLSDQALCELLSGNGAPVARRTVTKYRLELGIGSSRARRR